MFSSLFRKVTQPVIALRHSGGEKNENIALAFIKNFNALYLVFLSMKTLHVSWYFIILTHEKTEAQRGCVTCLKSQSLVMVDPGS